MVEGEYVKIRSKKGQDIFILDLKSYVEEQLRKGDYKEDRKDYKMQCPYCVDAYLHDDTYEGPYLKYKLYVLKDMNFGKCWRCNQWFIHNDETLNFEVPYFTEGTSSIKDFKLVKLDGELWNTELFESFDEHSDLGFQYLIEERHHYFKKLAKILKIRYSNDNPVIPFYYRGELIYYQFKLAFGNSTIPYFSPNILHKPLYIIEHGENKKFVIVEGTFDAIAALILYPDRTPAAILGSSITEYQIAMLRSYVPDDILVFMDNTDLSEKNADKIRLYINYANVHIRSSDGTDPEEYLKLEISRNTEIL